jgi:hypothetical protein
MFNPDTAPVSAYMPSFETAARSLKVVATIAPVHSDVEIETAIIALGREPGGGLIVMPDAFTAVHSAAIILAAARNNVPAVYILRATTETTGRCLFVLCPSSGLRYRATNLRLFLPSFCQPWSAIQSGKSTPDSSQAIPKSVRRGFQRSTCRWIGPFPSPAPL